ncbi:MAG: POTRA domain-containing protein [Flavobacteriales bacterium]
MKNLTLILFFLTFGIATVFSQKIELTVFFNDTTLKPSKLIAYNKYFDVGQLNTELSKIVNNLNAKAYLTASIDSIIVDTTYYKAYIHLGTIYKWNYLTPINIDEEVLSKIGFRDRVFNNKPFNKNQLTSFFVRIIKHYENNGFPFASLQFDSVRIENNTFRGNLVLEKNHRYKIDSVIIHGNATISKQYIQNYIRIKNGDGYNEALVKNISTRIKELPFVEEKQPFKVIFNESESKIIMDLKKKAASRFNGVLGIQPNNQTGKIRLTGDVKLNLLNSFKKGEEIFFNWRSIQEQTQDLNTGISYPFLLNTPFGLDYNFKLYKRDTTFIDVFNKIGIRYILKGNNYFSVFYQNKNSSLLSTKQFSSLTVLPDYADVSSQLYGIGIHYAKLDYNLNPRKGFSIVADGSVGTKIIKKNTAIKESLYDGIKLNTNLYNGNSIFDYYFPVSKRGVVKLSSKNGFTINESLFDNELVRIGGLFTLRGFDEESIYTTLYSIGTVEYRFILEQNSYLYLFVDKAYYEKNNIKGYVSDRPFGFGTGMSFDTKAGIFSISYALGQQFENPILFRSAKIHFGFINFF